MFNSKKELIEALMEGRRFKTPQGSTLFYDESKAMPLRKLGSISGEEQAIDALLLRYACVTEIKQECKCCCCCKCKE